MNGRLDILGLFHGCGHSICHPHIPVDLITHNKTPGRGSGRGEEKTAANGFSIVCKSSLICLLFVLRDWSRAAGENKLYYRHVVRQRSPRRTRRRPCEKESAHVRRHAVMFHRRNAHTQSSAIQKLMPGKGLTWHWTAANYSQPLRFSHWSCL